MSHLAERKEKNCLNCGAEVLGRYCQVCGQQNLEPKESFWHLVTHMINDITHFDGKFFETLEFLLFKPGFLSAEYVRGRRMRYLHPVRMYVFTSAIFFLVFFSLPGSKKAVNFNEKTTTYSALVATRTGLQSALSSEDDSAGKAELTEQIAKVNKKIDKENRSVARRAARGQDIRSDTAGIAAMGIQLPLDSLIAAYRKDTTNPQFQDAIDTSGTYGLGGVRLPNSLSGYDSMEAAKPSGWFNHFINRRIVRLNEDAHVDRKRFVQDSKEAVLHTFPKILFVSLPLFAFLLRLLNLRAKRRKAFYYVDHGIFTIHLYCATFIMMLALMLVDAAKSAYHLPWMGVISTLLFFAVFVYEYLAMRNFYRQGWGKTFLKFVLLNGAATILIGLVTAIFAVWAVLEV